MNEVVKTDVVLIGAGPIGLEMAVALKHAGIDYIHLEARQLGHTISWFPRQAHFFSSPERIAICGVPLITVDQSKATREEYLAYLLGIVQQFGLSIRSYNELHDCLSRKTAGSFWRRHVLRVHDPIRLRKLLSRAGTCMVLAP